MFSTSHSDTTTPSYQSLDEIRLRKAQLLTEITKDSNKIRKTWDSMFHRPKNQVTPTSRFSSTMKMGAGIVDGLILGWKLYRRFGSGSKSRSKFLGLF